ncbi:MAG: TIGR00645 family protein, partial [Thermomonas sp.]
KFALETGFKGAACNKVTSLGVMWQTIIHTIFILSALGIAWTDKVMTGSSSKREQHAH